MGQSLPQGTSNSEDTIKLIADDDVQTALKKTTEDVERTAARDGNGRIKQASARVFSEIYQNFQIDYKNSNIAGVTNEKGERVAFLRDKKGILSGLKFSNGWKALFQFHKSENGVLSVEGLIFLRPDGTVKFALDSSQLTNFQKVNFVKTTLSNKFTESSNRRLLDACSRAINTAGAAATATALACSAGNTVGCIAGGIATTVAVLNAIEICNE